MDIAFMGIIIIMHEVDTIVIGEEQITMEVNSRNLKIINLINERILIRTNMDVKLIH